MSNATDYLYLSTVAQRLPIETGGWSQDAIRRRGLALAVTWSAPQGGFRLYTDQDIPQLIADMAERIVVGYQVRVLDYQILHGHMPFEHPITLDLAHVVECVFGFKTAFNAVKRCTYMPTGWPSKALPTPAQITSLWQAGDHTTAERECHRHVSMLRFMHEHFMTCRWAGYVDAECERHVVDVPPTLLDSCIW